MSWLSQHDTRFGTRTGKLRKHRGISQTDLATQTGLGRCSIVEIENGRRRVSVGEAVAICAALDVSLVDMLSEQGLVLTTEVRID